MWLAKISSSVSSTFCGVVGSDTMDTMTLLLSPGSLGAGLL